MSGLIDIWTTEMAKLKQKGQTLFSTGSGQSNAGSVEEVKGKEMSSTVLNSAFGKIIGPNSALARVSSEASVFMVVACSP